VQISATVITLNEERNLARVLESMAPVADECVVVDSGSTDRTREIAEGRGTRFIQHLWDGFAAQKNFAAAQARHDWILSIDADEALSPELTAELQQLKREGPGEAVGFAMPRMARFRGRWIRHSGWYPDPKLRLYDRRRARWVGAYVHEHVQAEGLVRTLRGDLHHFPCDAWKEQLRSIDRYTTLAARQILESSNGRHGVSRAGVLVKLATLPAWKFFETYVLRQGFRDGRAGWLIARLAGYYVCQKYEKLWQMADQREKNARRLAE
jgi:glycosyltransferase involved in cell wall biosynthesis